MDLKEIMSEIRKFLEIAAGKFFTDAELAQFPHLLPAFKPDADYSAGDKVLKDDGTIVKKTDDDWTVIVDTEPVVFMEWSGDGITYEVGDPVTYQGLHYTCIHAHTSQPAWMPGAAFTEWAEVLVPVDRAGKQCQILEWKQPTGGVNEYHKGDKVLFNGVYYKSVMDDRADGTGANSWGPVGSSNPYADGWEVTDASL